MDTEKEREGKKESKKGKKQQSKDTSTLYITQLNNEPTKQKAELKEKDSQHLLSIYIFIIIRPFHFFYVSFN